MRDYQQLKCNTLLHYITYSFGIRLINYTDNDLDYFTALQQTYICDNKMSCFIHKIHYRPTQSIKYHPRCPDIRPPFPRTSSQYDTTLGKFLCYALISVAHISLHYYLLRDPTLFARTMTYNLPHTHCTSCAPMHNSECKRT